MSRTTSFNACKETVDSGQRLTVRQGKALLDYAIMQSDRAERHHRRADTLAIDVEVLKEDYQRFVEQWNELVHLLDEALGIRIYSNEFDDDKNSLWTVERDGKVVSKGHATIAQAYASVLKERL
jgi:L-rhamnose mutarotase